MECQKVKWKAGCNKNWAKSIKYASCILQVFCKPPKILPARVLWLNKKKQNINVFVEKVIPRSVRLIWSAEKSNVKQTAVKIRQSWLNIQAVPLAGSIF